MSSVTFPSAAQVEKDVQINRTVYQLKKFSFMNGCDTNITFKGVKESLISDPKIIKRLQWVQGLEKQIQRKISQRVKVLKQETPNPNFNPELYYRMADMVKSPSTNKKAHDQMKTTKNMRRMRLSRTAKRVNSGFPIEVYEDGTDKTESQNNFTSSVNLFIKSFRSDPKSSLTTTKREPGGQRVMMLDDYLLRQYKEKLLKPSLIVNKVHQNFVLN